MTTPPITPKPTPPPFVELPRYNPENLPLGEWVPYRKVAPTEMVRITGAFVVETRFGPLVCPDGWLARDSQGELYPIAADAHEPDFEPVEDEA